MFFRRSGRSASMASTQAAAPRHPGLRERRWIGVRGNLGKQPPTQCEQLVCSDGSRLDEGSLRIEARTLVSPWPIHRQSRVGAIAPAANQSNAVPGSLFAAGAGPTPSISAGHRSLAERFADQPEGHAQPHLLDRAPARAGNAEMSFPRPCWACRKVAGAQ